MNEKSSKKLAEPMSLQKMFDTAAVGMLRQGKKSIKNGDCQYRGSGGCKCAVGFLIPDDLYSPAIEGASIVYLKTRPDDGRRSQIELERILHQMKMLDDGRMKLLIDLQEIHDTAPMMNMHINTRLYWYRGLETIAQSHNLSTKSIDKVMKELTEASA